MIPQKQNKLNAWLRLVRAPNLLTLPGDILMGLVLTRINFTWVQVSLLIFCSIFIYCAGLILNDICDYQEDIELDRFQRPLVSGEITLAQAKKGFCCLSILTLTLSALVSWQSLLVSCLLLTLIVCYNCYARKFIFFGFLLMGSCRYANILLGGSVALSQNSSLTFSFWFFALLEAVFVVLICRIAYDEEKKMPSQFWAKSFLLIPVVMFGFTVFSIWANYQVLVYISSLSLFGVKSVQLISVIGSYWLSLLVLVYLCKIIINLCLKLKSDFLPQNIPLVIGGLIRSLILYQAFVVSFYSSSWLVCILIFAYFVNKFYSRQFYSS